MMLKIYVKNFLVIGSSVFASTVLANFYVGGGIGANNLAVEKNLSYASATTQKVTDSATGIALNIFGGYEMKINNNWSNRFEGELSYNTAETSSTIDNWFLTNGIGIKEKLTENYSVFLLPSYTLNQNTTLFFGPGVSFGAFSTKTVNGSAGNLGVSNNTKKNLTGLGVKGGISTMLTSNLALQLSYEYIQFNKATVAAEEPLSGDTVSSSYQPKINRTLLGLRYIF